MPTPNYPLDPTGQAPSNLIVDEIHTLTEINATTYRIIIPLLAPFYLDNFVLKYVDPNGVITPLVEDVDYTLCLPYMGATRSIGKMIYGGITINNDYINGVLKVTYQILGGDWVADSALVLETLAQLVYNPRTTVWDVVTNKPNQFPPINHDVLMDYVMGYGDLINALQSMANAILTGASPNVPIIRHLTDINNPHDTTAAQVGLSNVANLPLATLADALAGKLLTGDKYITFNQVISLLDRNKNTAASYYLSNHQPRRIRT